MKIKLSIVFLLFSINTFAQKLREKINQGKKSEIINPNKFTGIGIFKLLSDTDVLFTYASEHTDFIRDCDDETNYIDHIQKSKNDDLNGLYVLLHAKDDMQEIFELSKNPNVKQYYLTKYEVSGITIRNILLKYYKNKLVEVKCDDDYTLKDALEEKYGRPKITVTEEKTNCLYKLTGIVRPLVAKTYLSQWSNATIQLNELLWEKYDEHCEKSINQICYYSIKTPELELWEQSHKGYLLKKKDLTDF